MVKGKGEGKKLGFPTANLDYSSKEVPAPGVYAARALAAARLWRAAVIVGMWHSDGKPSVEVHLLDGQSDDLYGQEIVVAPYDRIRDLRQFDRQEDLVKQIQDDIKVCFRLSKQNSG